jgi:tripartite-type tricarboxylate transporter receptor subunit TctC
MIRLIVPYVKDGGTDTRARLLAGCLADRLGDTIEVVNHVGAVAGHHAIAAAPADGATLGMITGEIGMMHWQDGVTDLTPSAYTPLALPFVEAAAVIVRADAPFADLGDLLACLRARRLRGSGSPDFGVWKFALMGLLDAAGIARQQLDWTPSISGEAGVEALLAGDVDIAPVPMVEARVALAGGLARALATMDAVRHPRFPDIPTMREAVGIDWRVAHWRGLVAPAGLAEAPRARLIAALTAIAADPGFAERCRAIGFSLDWRIGDTFGRYMAEDDARFGAILRR